MSAKFSLNSALLKWIALVSMTVDHLALFFEKDLTAFCPALFTLLRILGRLAFPIFAFLLVEGFLHTRNRRAYGLRLLAFGLVSEVPYDLFHYGTCFSLEGQNAILTLLVGFVLLTAYDYFDSHHQTLLAFLSSGLLILAACLTRCDLALPMLIIVFMAYLFRFNRLYACLGSLLACLFEWPAIFALPLLYFYNGKRGRQMPYLFYIYYPLHLLILGLLALAC